MVEHPSKQYIKDELTKVEKNLLKLEEIVVPNRLDKERELKTRRDDLHAIDGGCGQVIQSSGLYGTTQTGGSTDWALIDVDNRSCSNEVPLPGIYHSSVLTNNHPLH